MPPQIPPPHQPSPDPPRAAVVAATDGTPRSSHVIGRAAKLAAQLDCRLVVTHVSSHKAAATATATAAATAAAAAAASTTASDAAPYEAGKAGGAVAGGAGTGGLGRLGRRLTRLTKAPSRDNKSPLRAIRAEMQTAGLAGDEALRLLSGEPAEEIGALADAEGAALLVLGLHGERRVLDALRLTTMEKIVLATQAPALIAHQPPGREYRQVLALTDFSPASATALALAARIAPDARFHALHMLALPLGARFHPDDPACDAAITQAEQARNAFLATPGLPDLHEPPLMVPGNLHELLQLRAREIGADLICIGINSGRDGGRLGYYARDLMRAPPLDLLVARA